MQKNRWISVTVGLFVALAIAGLFFLGFRASRLGGFSPGEIYHLHARFGDVSGLDKQATVSLSGVQIGRVIGFVLDPKTAEAVVSMEISKKVFLPGDSTAQIFTAGLLGKKYIGIIPGVKKTALQEGDTMTRTGDAMVLEKMLKQFSGAQGSYYPNVAYDLSARFDNISGLSVNAPVTLSGVQIGRVKSITLDQEAYQAVVGLEIASQYDRLPRDSSADILSSSILGGKYIGISPGGETAMLADGDVFQYTSSSIVLEKLISRFVTNMGNGK